MSDSLKEKTGTALFWNFIDKGGQQVIQFIFVFVLARLLEPEEFGLVAILSIFSVIAYILQDSGFSSALIRKKDVDEADYSSVFYFNLIISASIYLILFFCAPFIADFYNMPILAPLSRVLFLTFFFFSLGIIQNVHLVRAMDFRTGVRITFISGLASGCIAIWMAWSGYGVWSLVAQQVLQALFRSITLWLFVRWHPKTRMMMSKLKSMMSYSINILASAILNQIAGNIYPTVIGKNFSMSQVGYYGQASKLTTILQSIIGASLQGVAYPVLSKIDEDERLKRALRKIIRISSFICFPIITLLAVGAKPIVIIVLSDKFIASVPIVQLLAIGAAVYPLYCVIHAYIQSIGESRMLLKLEAFRSILSIGSIIITMQFGILAMVLGLSTANIIVFVTSVYISGKRLSYTLTEAFKDIIPYVSISVLVFFPLYFLNRIIGNDYILLGLQTVIGLGLYLLIVKILGSKVLEDCVEFFKSKKFK